MFGVDDGLGLGVTALAANTRIKLPRLMERVVVIFMEGPFFLGFRVKAVGCVLNAD